jgi:hypothetical protein
MVLDAFFLKGFYTSWQKCENPLQETTPECSSLNIINIITNLLDFLIQIGNAFTAAAPGKVDFEKISTDSRAVCMIGSDSDVI